METNDVAEQHEWSEETLRVKRRTFVASAAVGGAMIAAGAGLAKAQDASPTAETANTGATPVPGAEAGGPVPPELANAADTDWPVENLNLSNTRSVKGSPINSENVGTLELAWTFDDIRVGGYGALYSNPIISGNKLFLQDAYGNVYALDRETGEEIWANRYEDLAPNGGPAGLAVGYGAVVYPIGTADIVAADMETGEELWHVDITGLRGESVVQAPLVYDNKVYIGHTTGYQGSQRGRFIVLDMADGSVLWYLDLTENNLWGNAVVNAGAGLWHPPAVDEDGYVYIGTGNAAPYPGNEEWPAGSSRPGPNNWANSLIKIDPVTGSFIWAVNITGRDLFDLDNQLSPVLATVDYDGHPTPTVFASGKHGYMVAADPATGYELWRVPIGKHMNDKAQDIPEGEPLEVWPGHAVETGYAYQDNVLYVPNAGWHKTYSPTGIASQVEFSAAAGSLVAIDAANGSVIWETQIPSGVYAGAVVANDVVFTGALDGIVRAYKTSDGSLVWSAQTASGLNATLAVSGEYLYVPSGGPFFPSSDVQGDPPELKQQLIAYKLG